MDEFKQLHDAAQHAAADIARRRRRHRRDDPDVDVADLPSVVAYVARYRKVDPAVLRADALDQLRILRYLDAEADRQRHLAIATARATGASWATIAEPLGVDSRQGAQQLWLRLDNACRGGTRDEKAARRETTAAAAEQRQRLDRTAALEAFARGVLARRDLIPEDGVEDLPVDVHDLVDGLAERLPGGEYASLPGLADSLRLLVRWLTPILPDGNELRAVLHRGAEALPDRLAT